MQPTGASVLAMIASHGATSHNNLGCSASGRHKEALQAYEWAVGLAKAGGPPCARVDCRQCVREDRVHVSTMQAGHRSCSALWQPARAMTPPRSPVSSCKGVSSSHAAVSSSHAACLQPQTLLTQFGVLQVSMARALYAMGGSYQDAASTIVMNILSGNPTHPQALALYAQIAAGQGMLQDAIRVLLRLLVQRPDSRAVRQVCQLKHATCCEATAQSSAVKRCSARPAKFRTCGRSKHCLVAPVCPHRASPAACRQQIAQCFSRQQGLLQVLEAEMGGAGAGETHAALAFMASVIKDHGAVEASNSLLR